MSDDLVRRRVNKRDFEEARKVALEYCRDAQEVQEPTDAMCLLDGYINDRLGTAVLIMYDEQANEFALVAVYRNIGDNTHLKGYTFEDGSEAQMPFGVCKESRKLPGISDIDALRVWTSLPRAKRKIILNHAYCAQCLEGEFAPGYTVKSAEWGLLVEGTCATCGGYVAYFHDFE